MKKLINQLIVVFIPILMVACNSATTDSKTAETTETKDSQAFDLASAKTAIEAENTKFMEALKKGDSTTIASNYAQDAVLLPPNSESVKGDGIASLWGSFIGMGVKDLKLMIDDVSGNHDQLAETGHYELYGAENKMLDKGKYIVVWKQVNGTWKMYRDIWNTSMPAAPAK